MVTIFTGGKRCLQVMFTVPLTAILSQTDLLFNSRAHGFGAAESCGTVDCNPNSACGPPRLHLVILKGLCGVGDQTKMNTRNASTWIPIWSAQLLDISHIYLHTKIFQHILKNIPQYLSCQFSPLFLYFVSFSKVETPELPKYIWKSNLFKMFYMSWDLNWIVTMADSEIF